MGLLSSLFGGSQTVTTKAQPWGPQASQLQNIFGDAQNIYNAQAGTPWYQGPLVAGLDPLTTQGVNGVGAYAGGEGAAGAAQVGGVGSTLLGQSPEAYLASIGAFGNAAGADPTQANLAAAGAYANNPYLNAQIDAIGTDISRNLNENTLPAIDRAAVGTGNINSSRTGVAEGIAERGANEDLANAAAQVRGAAWNQGLNTAEAAREYNLGAMGEIPGMYAYGMNTGLNAANESNNLSLEDLNAMIQAGQINQQQNQNVDNANLYAWMQNDQRPMNLLDNYYNIIGNKNWGGTQTQTQTQSNGILSDIMGLGLTAAGLFGTGGVFPGALGGLFGGGGGGGGAGMALGLMG